MPEWPHWRMGVVLEGCPAWHCAPISCVPAAPCAVWGRDPANELYDEACALLAAAQGLRAAAGPRDSAPAIAASLGCVEASLEALATAVKVMRVAAMEAASDTLSADGPGARDVPQMRASFDWLARDLSASRSS